MTPRGIRLDNPGNIRHGAAWRGLERKQDDPDFCAFIDPLHGIRALAKVLLAYESRHGLRTIREIISRWAPGNENDTESYIRAVSAWVNRGPTEFYDVTDPHAMAALVTAIIRHENGQNPYSEKMIREGVALALA